MLRACLTSCSADGDTSRRLRLECDGTRAETRFRLSAKRTSPFKSAGASVQSTTGSWGVRISGSNAEYTMFRGSVESTGYPLHSPVSPSLPLPSATVCHHISTELQPKFQAATILSGAVSIIQHVAEVRMYVCQLVCHVFQPYTSTDEAESMQPLL